MLSAAFVATRSWLVCVWRSYPCRHYEDVGGCGGQCIRCGRIVGYVTRAQLRAYIERLERCGAKRKAG